MSKSDKKQIKKLYKKWSKSEIEFLRAGYCPVPIEDFMSFVRFSMPETESLLHELFVSRVDQNARSRLFSGNYFPPS